MDESIESVWADFCSRLKPRAVIRNWSVVNGYTGGEFVIHTVGPGGIMIELTTGTERMLAKGEVQKLLTHWETYKAGKVARVDLRNISHNTSYILSLLHWREL